MKHYLLLMTLFISSLLAACGQLTVGVEITATPTQAPTALVQAGATATVPAVVATPAPPEVEAPRTGCRLAYTDKTFVYCLEGDTLKLVADASALGLMVQSPKISSDGQWVAYLVNKPDSTTELWAVNVGTGESPRKLVGPDTLSTGDAKVANSPLNMQWQFGTHTIFFSTRYTPIGVELGPMEYLNLDVWRVDVESGAMTTVLARGTAGEFALSPNGQTLAFASTNQVGVLSLAGGTPQISLEFEPVKTYSEWAYRPHLQWNADSATFSALIPSPEPFQPTAAAEVYQISAEGVAQKRTTLTGNLILAGTKFSPDGQRLAYGQYNPTANAGELWLANVADGQPRVWATPFTDLWGWSPDGQAVAYSHFEGLNGGDLMVLTVGGETQKIAPNATMVSLRWVDTKTVYFHSAVGDVWGIYSYTLGGQPQLVANVPDATAGFDVR